MRAGVALLVLASCGGPTAVTRDPAPIRPAATEPAPAAVPIAPPPRVIGLHFAEHGYALLEDGTVGMFARGGGPIAPMSGLDDAVQLDAHLDLACARRRSGRVTCFGDPLPDRRGAGHGLRPGPTDVEGIDDAIDLVVGSQGGCVLRATGEVWCWGHVVNGHEAPDHPRPVATPAPIVELTRTRWDLRAIAADGRMFRWDGAGRDVEETTYRGRPGARLEEGRAIDEDGLPFEVELHDPIAIDGDIGGVCVVERDRGVACLAGHARGERARSVHRVEVPDAREVHVVGYDVHVLHGERGIATFELARRDEPPSAPVERAWRAPFVPADPGPAVELAAGAAFACARHARGAVRCWGEDAHGQLGDGDPAAATGPVWVYQLEDAIALAAGHAHACAARRDGSVVCWGSGQGGVLGSHRAAVAPVVIEDVEGAIGVTAAYELSCALLDTGRVRCWGDASQGQMGPGAQGPRMPPTDVAGVEDAVAIAVGYHSLVVVRRDGSLRAFGSIAGSARVRDVPTIDVRAIAVDRGSAAGACRATHDDRVLCDGMPPLRGHAFAIDAPRACASGEQGVVCVERGGRPSPIEGLAGATSLAIEDRSVCGIVDGEVRCVGVAGRWLGEPVPGIAGATAVFALDEGGCAVTAEGTRCWGAAAAPAAASIVRGAEDGGTCWIEGGVVSCAGPDGATPSVRPFGASAPATRLAVGFDPGDVCAVVGTDAWCRGAGRPRRVARDVLDVAQAPSDRDRSLCVLARDGRVRCGSATRLTDTGVSGAVELAAGGMHGCARLADGGVSCWGRGGGDDPPSVVGTGERDADDLRVRGIDDAIALAAAGDATCAVRADHTVACWGSGAVVGPVPYALSPIPIPGLSGVTAISLSEGHACAVVEGGRVRCWGRRSRDADVLGDEGAGAVVVPVP